MEQKDVVFNLPYNILNIIFDEYTNSLYCFRLSNKALKILLNNKILNLFEQYGYLFNNVVITSIVVKFSQDFTFGFMKYL